MKRQHGCKSRERGKYYRPGPLLHIPIYLEETVQSYFTAKANLNGISLSDLVNEVLKKEISIIESVK